MQVAADDECVRLTVRDDGDPTTFNPQAARGYGLIGMRERATLLGGTLEAGRPGRPRLGDHRRAAPSRSAGLSGVTDPVRVLVADDQELVRTGLRMILDAQPDIEVVGVRPPTVARRSDSRATCAPTSACSTSGCRGSTASRHPPLAGPGVDDPMAVVIITTFDLDEYVHGALRGRRHAASC